MTQQEWEKKVDAFLAACEREAELERNAEREAELERTQREQIK